jgi:GNAT superfamily N-acetyltransferase
VRIRQATIADYAGLCAVLDEVDAQHIAALPNVFRDPGERARSQAYVASIVQDENACLWIAEHGADIVGVLHICIRETRPIPLFVPRRYAVIENVAISQAYRRQGIGRALVERADRWALDRGATQTELNVWEFNEGARAFYDALGYKTASRKMVRDLPAASRRPSEADNP